MTSSLNELLRAAWRTFLSGLVTVLPVAVTIYVVWWLAGAAESVFGGTARFVLPAGWYVPGIGVLMAVGVVFLVGAFLNAWLFSRLVAFGERMLGRIPVIKTFYGGLRDLFRFLSGTGAGTEMRKVVSVELQPDVHVIGFVTDEDAGTSLPELARDDDRLVAVYLPMGYQVGGYTLYLPASRLKPLDLSIEEAMRVVLTAGVNRPRRGGSPTDSATGS